MADEEIAIQIFLGSLTDDVPHHPVRGAVEPVLARGCSPSTCPPKEVDAATTTIAAATEPAVEEDLAADAAAAVNLAAKNDAARAGAATPEAMTSASLAAGEDVAATPADTVNSGAAKPARHAQAAPNPTVGGAACIPQLSRVNAPCLQAGLDTFQPAHLHASCVANPAAVNAAHADAHASSCSAIPVVEPAAPGAAKSASKAATSALEAKAAHSTAVLNAEDQLTTAPDACCIDTLATVAAATPVASTAKRATVAGAMPVTKIAATPSEEYVAAHDAATHPADAPSVAEFTTIPAEEEVAAQDIDTAMPIDEAAYPDTEVTTVVKSTLNRLSADANADCDDLVIPSFLGKLAAEDSDGNTTIIEAFPRNRPPAAPADHAVVQSTQARRPISGAAHPTFHDLANPATPAADDAATAANPTADTVEFTLPANPASTPTAESPSRASLTQPASRRNMARPPSLCTYCKGCLHRCGSNPRLLSALNPRRRDDPEQTLLSSLTLGIQQVKGSLQCLAMMRLL
ncbi:hypothetical protein GOP47_0005951 [Adiantum capillus-veneris]|uniref:Uncharacterized protein n=1 Tax=Adiantum capillus-veneris TaxID=13818 RepID=A0A9D4ZML0_ADICA|nr:hypothetical protein GOP47_0005951 [Adiantum capillus-veneris]